MVHVAHQDMLRCTLVKRNTYIQAIQGKISLPKWKIEPAISWLYRGITPRKINGIFVIDVIGNQTPIRSTIFPYSQQQQDQAS